MAAMSSVCRTLTTIVFHCLLPLYALQLCAGVQIPSRFTYINEQTNTDAVAADRTSIHHHHRRSIEGNPKVTDAIPMEFYAALDNVTDVFEFQERFIADNNDPQLGIQGNFRQNVERAASVIPKPANCIPESTIVPLISLNPSNDPKVFYMPKCTRVKRCGGCCSSELMSCQSTDSEVINFEVSIYRYDGRPRIVGKEIIPVEQHTKCKCDCRIKPEDCNSYQIYRRELCRCTCTNDDALQKCLTQDHKIWDEKDCRCVCRDPQPCTTGTIFDENQCKCVSINQYGYFE